MYHENSIQFILKYQIHLLRLYYEINPYKPFDKEYCWLFVCEQIVYWQLI